MSTFIPDFNGDGSVSYLEFIKLVVGEKQVTAMAHSKLRVFFCQKLFQKPAREVTRQQIVALFEQFDTDSSGVITLDEFRQAFIAVGVSSEAEELDLLIRCVVTMTSLLSVIFVCLLCLSLSLSFFFVSCCLFFCVFP